MPSFQLYANSEEISSWENEITKPDIISAILRVKSCEKRLNKATGLAISIALFASIVVLF